MSEKSGAAKSPKPEGKPQKTEAKPQKSEDAPQKSEEKSLPVEVRPTPRMQVRYRDEIVPAMMKEFNYRNIMEVRASRRLPSISAWARQSRTARHWKRQRVTWRL